ncbi:TolB family protein [Flavimaricola marinus]|uniref:Translocation protein TolB n=1 Tax=Flavimaricola marinus TaxID=1819565 RepID=A0A238L9Y7_9RHOB|nr:PD40 domain-containing protein [Flavimaricola marinus]SMY06234.1 translocation protein TolB [Flavimaricola marinus]
MRPKSSRRHLPNQICELVVATRDGSELSVVYETSELIEAPNWTPDGRWLIYNADGRVFRISPDGTDGPHRINTAPIEDLNNDHVISPDGKSLFLSANDGHLYRCPIEGGIPEKLSNDQDPSRKFRYYLHGISPDGQTLSYVGYERGDGANVTRICTIPAAGGADTVLTDGACPVDGPEYSADGAWIYFNSEAAATQPGHAQIFRMRPDGSGTEQLTHDARVNWFPHAAPDGTIFSYISFPTGTLGHPADKDVIIRTMAPDGSDVADIDQFNGGQGSINVTSWAPDSQRFAYVRYPVRG